MTLTDLLKMVFYATCQNPSQASVIVISVVLLTMGISDWCCLLTASLLFLKFF